MNGRRTDLHRTATKRPSDPTDHVAPDCSGLNFFDLDRGVRDLLRLYLSREDPP